jgi:Protein of unknown function (DUF1203)
MADFRQRGAADQGRIPDMTTITRSFQIQPITGPTLRELRAVDDAGRRPHRIADDGGSPLRCCLRRSRGGESIALVSYAPLRRWAAETHVDPGPFDEVGPVYIHTFDCDGPADGWPAALFDGRRMLRAYDAAGTILGATLVERDDDAEHMLAELFTDPQVAVVHPRFAEFGCFMFEARRVSASDGDLSAPGAL